MVKYDFNTIVGHAKQEGYMDQHGCLLFRDLLGEISTHMNERELHDGRNVRNS